MALLAAGLDEQLRVLEKRLAGASVAALGWPDRAAALARRTGRSRGGSPMKAVRAFLATAVAFLGIDVLPADTVSSSPPGVSRYCSTNGAYCLEITPARFVASLDDEAEENESPGAPAQAAFLVRGKDGQYERAVFPLLDLPHVRVLVTDDGARVITTSGSWTGNHAVVIYRADGSVVKDLSLEDLLTQEDIDEIGNTTTSIPWYHGASIDGDDLVLQAEAFEREVGELKIDLSTGRPLAPKRDLFPHIRGVRAFAEDTAVDATAWRSLVCRLPGPRFDSPHLLHVSSEKLFRQAIECPPPVTPRVARISHLQGMATLEVLVAATGEVACVRFQGLGVMGLEEASEAAVLQWRFQPFAVAGKPVPAVGRIALRYTRAAEPPEGSCLPPPE